MDAVVQWVRGLGAGLGCMFTGLVVLLAGLWVLAVVAAEPVYLVTVVVLTVLFVVGVRSAAGRRTPPHDEP